ncbi:MAG: FAD:protein FMN transferase, partial [Lachnospiraceae bacterium]|nr:FAD:protein FMN transferase [Lachnospiraceae bacterium]
MPGSTPCISHKIPFVLSLVCLFFMISSCTPATEVTTVEGFFFDTFINIVIYDPCSSDITDGCIELCSHYDNLFSKSVPESDIYRINHAAGAPVTVSEDTVFLLSEAIRYAGLTDGKIDPTIETVGSLWDFHPSDTPKLPDETEIASALTHVDYRNIRITDTTVTLTDPESSLSLAFLAKGYIADKLKEYLLANGIQNAIINLGGNTVVLGSKPDNEPFTVGVEFYAYRKRFIVRFG